MPELNGVNWKTVYIGKSRYYQNPETGELLSRRAFDKARGMLSFEARAKQRATSLGVSVDKKQYKKSGTVHREYTSKNLDVLRDVFQRRVGKAYAVSLRFRIGNRWFETRSFFIANTRSKTLQMIWNLLLQDLTRIIISYKGEALEDSPGMLARSADEYVLVLIS